MKPKKEDKGKEVKPDEQKMKRLSWFKDCLYMLVISPLSLNRYGLEGVLLRVRTHLVARFLKQHVQAIPAP